jgi:hypothetical protein
MLSPGVGFVQRLVQAERKRAQPTIIGVVQSHEQDCPASLVFVSFGNLFASSALSVRALDRCWV